jgi:hypothetical protein
MNWTHHLDVLFTDLYLPIYLYLSIYFYLPTYIDLFMDALSAYWVTNFECWLHDELAML